MAYNESHDHKGQLNSEHDHHHHHEHKISSLNGTYIVAITLNLLFVFIETTVGFISNSLGLVSDAGHNLSDVLSLVLAMIALKLAQTHRKGRFTYGYKKSSVLISLLNAIILLVAVGAIIIESIHKFSVPVPVDGVAVSWTAGIGILINGFTALMLMKQQKHDINTRGAFLHMVADTLVSIGVVISGIVITVTGWIVIDPIIGLVIALVILVSTWNLLSESLKMSIDAVPESIDIEKLEKVMLSENGVTNVHHIHIWPISTTEIALTAHIVIDDVMRLDEITCTLKEKLSEYGIQHSTIEIETDKSHCEHNGCC